MELKKFWNNKKVFLTGHTGFKGAWLTLILHELGAKVTGYSSDVPTTPSVYERARSSELLEKDHRGDICDLHHLRKALMESSAEIVFHLAAQSLVRTSYADPIATYQTNVMGTLNVLMACHEAQSVKSIVTVTSDKCYHNEDLNRSFSEQDKLGGHDPYSSSKACAEIISASIRSSFLEKTNKNMATVRTGNVIGGGDWAADRLIPDFMRAYVSGERFVMRNPASLRPWMHVLEPLAAYLTLAEKNYQGGGFTDAFNLGPDVQNYSQVSEVIDLLKGHFPDHPGIQVSAGSGDFHEAKTLRLDCTKAKTKIGWTPRLDLKQVIELTAECYRADFAGEDFRELALKQIRNYF